MRRASTKRLRANLCRVVVTHRRDRAQPQGRGPSHRWNERFSASRQVKALTKLAIRRANREFCLQTAVDEYSLCVTVCRGMAWLLWTRLLCKLLCARLVEAVVFLPREAHLIKVIYASVRKLAAKTRATRSDAFVTWLGAFLSQPSSSSSVPNSPLLLLYIFLFTRFSNHACG